MAASASSDHTFDPIPAQNTAIPVWYENGSFTKAGEKALEILNNTEENGISPGHYNAGQLTNSQQQKITDPAGVKKINEQVTQSLVLYLLDLKWGVGQAGGRLEKFSEQDNQQYKAYFTLVLNLLVNVPDYNIVLGHFQTDNEQYVKLRQSLATYRNVAASQLIKPVEVSKPIKPGEDNAEIAQIRQDIEIINGAAKNDIFANVTYNPSTAYDEKLAGQVRQFQKITGQEANGVITKQTVAKLNGYIPESVAQIKFTMNRLRGEESHGDPKFVIVNLPEFKLYAYNNGKQEFSMPVVVGQVDKATPEFSNHIDTVVLNPDWHPTAKISRELVAKMRRSPEFLAKGGYEVKWANGETIAANDYQTIDWKQVDASQISIRQSSGPSNALGNIKFLMPNSDDIYLHDTNARSLFKTAYRALSHGCIRLGDPMKLAEFVLGDLFKEKKVEQKVGHGGSEYIKVAAIPVYTIYHTAWIDGEGFTNVVSDVYHKNKKFETATQAPSEKINALLAMVLPVAPGAERASINVNEVAANVNPATP